MSRSSRLRLREAGPLGTRPPAGTQLLERGRLGEASTETPHRRNIQIITPGWGSSGYYSAAVLERAADEKVIPAGTHMYLNHASASEHADRPERDVEKIAAVLVEDATWDGERLTAPADLLGPNGELIEAIAPYIGVSISGSATDIVIGEAEGRRGPIIEGLAVVDSVDFVTHAGRGGMVLLEEARPSLVAARATDRGVAEATVNDIREALEQAIRETHGDENTWCWVRDFDDTRVWFSVEDSDSYGLYEQGYTQDDAGAVALVGDWIEVRARTEYVPVEPTSSGTNDVPASRSGNTTTEENNMPEIEEARLRQLEADAGRVSTLESERDQARSENAQLRAREGARTFAHTRVTTANAELPAAVIDRVVESAMTGDLPLTEAGQLDEAAFGTRVDEARTAEEAYLGRLTGTVDGSTTKVVNFGHSTPETPVTEAAPTRSPWGRETRKDA